MNTYSISQDLADRLEKDIIIDCKPRYTYLKDTANYNYRNNSPTAGGQKILRVQGFTNGVYTMLRHYPIYGTYEKMIEHDPTCVPAQAPSITELVYHLREQHLDPSYDIVRVYVNIMTIGIQPGVTTPHFDIDDEEAITFLYYVVDSDGDTFLFDEETDSVIFRHSPKKGTGIYYPSKTIHAASIPVAHEIRSALNIIYSKNYFKRNGNFILREYDRRNKQRTRQHR